MYIYECELRTHVKLLKIKLYQVASATASPRYVKPLFFLKKIAVFEYMLYY